MIRVEISRADMMTAKDLRFDHPHPRVQLRMEVLWLERHVLPRKQVCSLAGVSPDTVRHFRRHPVASIGEAIAVMEELTGIKRNPTHVRKFLKSLGIKRLKVGSVPSKADPDEQEKFKEEKMEPRLKEAKAGKRVVLFVDAAHFVLSAYLGFL